jgi:hypothetical protein
MFDFTPIGLSILGGYFEEDKRCILVFLRALGSQEISRLLSEVASQPSEFDRIFVMVEEVVQSIS